MNKGNKEYLRAIMHRLPEIANMITLKGTFSDFRTMTCKLADLNDFLQMSTFTNHVNSLVEDFLRCISLNTADKSISNIFDFRCLSVTVTF